MSADRCNRKDPVTHLLFIISRLLFSRFFQFVHRSQFAPQLFALVFQHLSPHFTRFMTTVSPVQDQLQKFIGNSNNFHLAPHIVRTLWPSLPPVFDAFVRYSIVLPAIASVYVLHPYAVPFVVNSVDLSVVYWSSLEVYFGRDKKNEKRIAKFVRHRNCWRRNLLLFEFVVLFLFDLQTWFERGMLFTLLSQIVFTLLELTDLVSTLFYFHFEFVTRIARLYCWRCVLLCHWHLFDTIASRCIGENGKQIESWIYIAADVQVSWRLLSMNRGE